MPQKLISDSYDQEQDHEGKLQLAIKPRTIQFIERDLRYDYNAEVEHI